MSKPSGPGGEVKVCSHVYADHSIDYRMNGRLPCSQSTTNHTVHCRPVSSRPIDWRPISWPVAGVCAGGMLWADLPVDVVYLPIVLVYLAYMRALYVEYHT